jgi:hypothetical protein
LQVIYCNRLSFKVIYYNRLLFIFFHSIVIVIVDIKHYMGMTNHLHLRVKKYNVYINIIMEFIS